MFQGVNLKDNNGSKVTLLCFCPMSTCKYGGQQVSDRCFTSLKLLRQVRFKLFNNLIFGSVKACVLSTYLKSVDIYWINTCFLSHRGFYGIAVFVFTYGSMRWNWHLKSECLNNISFWKYSILIDFSTKLFN